MGQEESYQNRYDSESEESEQSDSEESDESNNEESEQSDNEQSDSEESESEESTFEVKDIQQLLELYNNGYLNNIQVPGSSRILQLKQFMGKGAYGIVFSAFDTYRNEMVAIKLFIINDIGEKKEFLDEYNAYHKLSNSGECARYIVCQIAIFDFMLGQTRIGVIVTELMDSDLGYKPPNEGEILLFVRDSLRALRYIHGKEYAHRDIKPANILRVLPEKIVNISETGKTATFIKIGDPGLLCNTSDVSCSYIGSPGYQSPHALQHFEQDANVEMLQKEDIWAWGVTLCRFLDDIYWDFDKVKNDEDILVILSEIAKSPILSSYQRGIKLLHIVQSALRYAPEKRLTAKQLLHNFEKEFGLETDNIVNGNLGIVQLPIIKQTRQLSNGDSHLIKRNRK